MADLIPGVLAGETPTVAPIGRGLIPARASGSSGGRLHGGRQRGRRLRSARPGLARRVPTFLGTGAQAGCCSPGRTIPGADAAGLPRAAVELPPPRASRLTGADLGDRRCCGLWRAFRWSQAVSGNGRTGAVRPGFGRSKPRPGCCDSAVNCEGAHRHVLTGRRSQPRCPGSHAPAPCAPASPWFPGPRTSWWYTTQLARGRRGPWVVRAGIDGEGGRRRMRPLAVADTIKRVKGRRVVETVPRTRLVTVQTPQASWPPCGDARRAGGADGTDDAAISGSRRRHGRGRRRRADQPEKVTGPGGLDAGSRAAVHQSRS